MSKKKKNSIVIEHPIDFVEVSLLIEVKDKSPFRKRWKAPSFPLRLTSEALRDTARLKPFLLDLGKDWKKTVEQFIKDLT